jgi:hypothetical protein
MIKYVIIVVLLLPSLGFTETKCSVIDYPDHDVAVCNGDEAASRISDQTIIPPQPPPTAVQSITKQTDANIPAPSDVSQKSPAPGTADTPQTETKTTSQPAQPVPNQGTVIHRQGRQQYQQSMEDAKAARRQLILDKQQMQTSPPATAAPAPSGTTPN